MCKYFEECGRVFVLLLDRHNRCRIWENENGRLRKQ